MLSKGGENSMVVVFFVLAIAGYLGFLVDWRELKDVLGQGGWAALVLYVIITILIYAVLISPAAVAVSTHH
jgi:hypothetical protein